MSLERITAITLILMGIYFSVAFTIRWYEIKYGDKYDRCGVVVKKYQVLVKKRDASYANWIQIKDKENNLYDFIIHSSVKNLIISQKINENSNVCFQFVNLSSDFGYSWLLDTKKVDKRLLHIEKKY